MNKIDELVIELLNISKNNDQHFAFYCNLIPTTCGIKYEFYCELFDDDTVFLRGFGSTLDEAAADAQSEIPGALKTFDYIGGDQ